VQQVTTGAGDGGGGGPDAGVVDGGGGGGDERVIVPMPGVTPVAVPICPMLLFLMKLFSSTVALVFRITLNWSANSCARVFWATSKNVSCQAPSVMGALHPTYTDLIQRLLGHAAGNCALIDAYATYATASMVGALPITLFSWLKVMSRDTALDATYDVDRLV
jgi:hypothetical protein